MIEILETAEAVKKLGLKWTRLASKHSVAMGMTTEDRNLIAGEVYDTRKALDCALAHIEHVVRRSVAPTESEADEDTLQICGLQSLQVND